MKYIPYIVAFIMALSLVTTGCGSSKTEKEMNNETDTVAVVEETETEEVDEVDVTEDEEDDTTISGSYKDDETEVNYNAGNNVVWPDDIPSYYPKLSGVLVGVVETSDDEMTSYTLAFENVLNNDFNEFKKTIESTPGWKIMVKSQTTDGWMINAMHEKEEASLMVIVDLEDNSGGMNISFMK